MSIPDSQARICRRKGPPQLLLAEDSQATPRDSQSWRHLARACGWHEIAVSRCEALSRNAGRNHRRRAGPVTSELCLGAAVKNHWAAPFHTSLPMGKSVMPHPVRQSGLTRKLAAGDRYEQLYWPLSTSKTWSRPLGKWPSTRVYHRESSMELPMEYLVFKENK